MPPLRRVIVFLFADIGMWLAASAIFLAVYVGRFSLPTAAIVPHLGLAATVWLALALVRMLAQALPGKVLPRFVSAFALGIGWTALLAYYGLVLIGLSEWGRVVSSDLVRTYARQFPELADALGFSPVAILAIFSCGFALILCAMLWYMARFDWIPSLQQRISRTLALVICGGALATVGIEAYGFVAAPWIHEREPLSLTLFPDEADRDMQAHRIERVQAELLDKAEDAARAAYKPADSVDRRNVVVIVVDALRPDHLGILGYPRNTTPELATIARRATRSVAMSVHTSCAESACGLMSLASSRYVHQFSYRPITLSEVLKRNGYAVRFILSGDHTHFYGLREAYGKVDSYFDTSMAAGYYMNDDRALVEQVTSLPAWNGVPTMFQFHLMSAHALGKRLDAYRVFTPAANYAAVGRTHGTDGVPDADAVNYYDNGVRQADAIIAQLLAQLTSKHYLDDAVVVVTADHGELLGEHGLYTHAKSVYEEVLQVPMILLSFGYQPRPLKSRPDASQIDIAPTVLAELGIPSPATWRGKALQQSGERDIGYFQEGAIAGLYDYRSAGRVWKYYIDMRTGEEHVVDLANDRTERNQGGDLVSAAVLRDWRALVLPTVRGVLK